MIDNSDNFLSLLPNLSWRSTKATDPTSDNSFDDDSWFSTWFPKHTTTTMTTNPTTNTHDTITTMESNNDEHEKLSILVNEIEPIVSCEPPMTSTAITNRPRSYSSGSDDLLPLNSSINRNIRSESVISLDETAGPLSVNTIRKTKNNTNNIAATNSAKAMTYTSLRDLGKHR